MTKMPIGLSSRFVLGLAVGASLALAACSKPEPAQEPVRSVKVMTVGVDTFKSGYEYAGEVRPRVESRLGFRVAGKIVKRQADLGQRVKAGQVLAQLDPRDYQLAADAARAQVAAATTNRDLAAADFRRYAALKDQNFISGAELERRETNLKAARGKTLRATPFTSSPRACFMVLERGSKQDNDLHLSTNAGSLNRVTPLVKFKPERVVNIQPVLTAQGPNVPSTLIASQGRTLTAARLWRF